MIQAVRTIGTGFAIKGWGFYLSLLLVFFFYKIELIFFSKILSIYWLLPLICSTSAILVLIFRNLFINHNNKFEGIQMNKLIYLFIVTFIFTSFYLIVTYYLNDHFNTMVNSLLYLMNISVNLSILNSDSFFSVYNFKMEETLDNSTSTLKQESSGNNSRSSSPSGNNLNLLDYITKVLKLGDHRAECTKLRCRMNDLILKVEGIKIVNDLQVIEEEDGSLGIELPEDVDDKTSKFLSKKIGVIDAVFNHYCDKMQDIFKKSDIICQEIEGHSPAASRQIALMETHKERYDALLNKYKSLIEEA